MPALTEEQIEQLLTPYVHGKESMTVLPDDLFRRLGVYLDLLLRWNTRTNLTAIREPGEIVRRHFGESLFAGLRLQSLVSPEASVLDLGSGAGFPGIPLQLVCPNMRVTLAESQGKKAAFLREVVRSLGLQSEVWAARVESMAETRRFEAVTLRAVDRMEAMVRIGRSRLQPGGVLLEFVGSAERDAQAVAVPDRASSFVRISRNL